MINFLKICMVLMPALLFSCTGNHLISDKNYRNEVEKSFAERQKLAEQRKKELFGIFDSGLTTEQEEALKFLYAYMPLNDLADYDGKFFLANADRALMARSKVPWGKDIPEDIFLHYVLPYRVNNENLDTFRIACFDEIQERIKNKDLTSAALEINYWCHEKVTYQPADIRTSAPLSTMLSARGRCGEESTFTVAALRTAGIPARQVYTPRWAHSDDNHAWVEVWIDGSWYYMGACEPEAVLDRGWFTEPARRAMLVHTKSFGAPYGKENVITQSRNYTNVNNLSKYAVTKTIFVKVLDSKGVPVSDAKVEYQLYNYAEFYPLAIVPTDDKGMSSFETGLGDLLVWASKENDFDYEKISVSEIDTLLLKLNSKDGKDYHVDLDLNVPPSLSPLPGISDDLVAANSERVKKGNEIRQSYINTWMKPEEAVALALKLNTDTAATRELISKSMGNYKEISSFLLNTPENQRKTAMAMLELLPAKDLRDSKAEILSDHLLNCVPFSDGDPTFELKYILNPRIANEIIVPWRKYLRENIPADLTKNNPGKVVEYINSTIKLADEENYYKTPITPTGVNKLKIADEASRAIYFVAVCRTLGIPSRLEPARNVPQYFNGTDWKDVYFAGQTGPGDSKGYIRLKTAMINPVPEYYAHFTLARFENGRYNTLDYDYNRKVNEFTEELVLPAGKYMLVTGNRINDSRILSGISFFELKENEHKIIDVNLRSEAIEKKILGKVDLEQLISSLPLTSKIENADKKGIVIAWIEPEQEPTKHILNDLPLLREELDEWGGYFIFLADAGNKTGNLQTYKGLPEKSVFSYDDMMKAFKSAVKLDSPQDVRLPFVIVADKNGNIIFTSAGYRIGIGEQILKYIR